MPTCLTAQPPKPTPMEGLFFSGVGGGGKGHVVVGRDSGCRSRARGPHAHRNTARQATDGLWTEARGQHKQVDGNTSQTTPASTSTTPNTPTTGRR